MTAVILSNCVNNRMFFPHIESGVSMSITTNHKKQLIIIIHKKRSENRIKLCYTNDT